jgi:SH3-like domain-containing protein
MTSNKTVRVAVGHTSTFPDPLVAPAGTKLTLEPRSSEFAGWVWCRDAAGTGAWVPEAFLTINGEVAMLTVDYDSTEMTVVAGVSVEIVGNVAGWAWCRDADGRLGWLPVDNLGEFT